MNNPTGQNDRYNAPRPAPADRGQTPVRKKKRKNGGKVPSIFVVILALLCVVVAILFFKNASVSSLAYRRVLKNAIGVLLVAAALLLFYYVFLTRESEPNFFLYDKRAGKNIKPDKLTFEIVNGKMNFYLSLIAQNEEDLWQGDVLLQNDKFGYRGIFRPLVAYKMLFDLQQLNSETVSAWFFGADDDIFRALCDSLAANRDSALVDRLRNHRAAGSPENLIKFLSGNRKYIQNKMVNFVFTNVDLFY